MIGILLIDIEQIQQGESAQTASECMNADSTMPGEMQQRQVEFNMESGLQHRYPIGLALWDCIGTVLGLRWARLGSIDNYEGYIVLR